MISIAAFFGNASAANLYTAAIGNADWDSDVWSSSPSGPAAPGLRPANGDNVQLRAAGLNLSLAAKLAGTFSTVQSSNTSGSSSFTLESGAVLSSVALNNAPNGVGAVSSMIINQGSIAKIGSTGIRIANAANGTGSLTVNGGYVTSAGPLVIAGSASSTGTLTLISGLLSVTALQPGSGSATFNWSGGTLAVGDITVPSIQNSGNGVLDIGGAGVVDPDGLQHSSPAAIYDQGPYAMLRIDLESNTSYDYYNASSASSDVTLEGVVTVYLLGSYVPAAGTTFDIIRAASLADNGVVLRGPAAELFDVSVVTVGAQQRLRLTTKSTPVALKAPFRTLFGNDTTHILSVAAPWAQTRPSAFTTALLQSSIQEAEGNGLDVHLLQPGLGWVPWWQSLVLPVPDHTDWARTLAISLGLPNNRLPRTPNSYENYIENNASHDMVQTLVDECNNSGGDARAFISYRLNDYHHISIAVAAAAPNPPTEIELANSQFYYEHPEWRVGDNAEDQDTNAANDDVRVKYLTDWSYPAVVQYKLNLIKEIIALYDIDGLELDFMRHWIFFGKDVPNADRLEIMLRFVREVRTALDQKDVNRRLWLCARIPGYQTDPVYGNLHSRAGIDIRKFADAGVDMFNLSQHYHTDPLLNVSGIRTLLPARIAIYSEQHYTNAINPPGSGFNSYRMTTELQHYTAAFVAYLRGADGISTFNLQYSRNPSAAAPTNNYDPLQEPPFTMFNTLGDIDDVGSKPQHYAIGLLTSGPKKGGRALVGVPEKDVAKNVVFFTAKPIVTPGDLVNRDWTTDGVLRIQGVSSLASATFEVMIGTTVLVQTTNPADLAEPYVGSGYKTYTNSLGNPADYQAWIVPKGILTDVTSGSNTLKITLRSATGTSPQLIYVDLKIQ